MKLQLVFLLAIAPLLAACSTTQSTTTNVVPAPSSNVASATISRDFYVAVDSIVVHFEDDSAHTVVLHRHDVIHVEGHATASTYRAHIGEHFARVPTSALSEYDGAHSTTPATGSGHSLQTGPRGGKYYINSSGKKTYVKKK